MPNDRFAGHLHRGLNSSLEEKRSLSKCINPNLSVLSLFVDQNKAFAKGEVRKNCAEVDAILQWQGRGSSAGTQTPETILTYSVWLH